MMYSIEVYCKVQVSLLVKNYQKRKVEGQSELFKQNKSLFLAQRISTLIWCHHLPHYLVKIKYWYIMFLSPTVCLLAHAVSDATDYEYTRLPPQPQLVSLEYEYLRRD